MLSTTPPQPPTVGKDSPSPETLPQLPRKDGHLVQPPLPPRRTSFNFLRRSKSGELAADRDYTVSGPSKLSKKGKGKQQEDMSRQQPEAEAVPLPRPQQPPPRLPNPSPLPQIATFGGESPRPASVAILPDDYDRFLRNLSSSRYAMSSPIASPPTRVPISPAPRSSPGYTNGEYVNSHARTESMTHRSRYSYALSPAVSNVDSPRRVRRRKDPTPFNVLVIGAKNSGKTSFINFLRSSLALPEKKRGQTSSPLHSTQQVPNSPFTSHYIETEVESERIGLTIWDSPGLEKNIVDLQLREMTSFLESKFEDTFTEEQKLVRAPGVQDTHIHCVFLLLDPLRLDGTIAASQTKGATVAKFSTTPRIVSSLNEDLDLQVLRTLQGKTTVIPVISKADTVTSAHMAYLKRTVWDSLKRSKLDPLEALDLDDSESDGDTVDPDTDGADEIGIARELGPDTSRVDLTDSDDSDVSYSIPTSRGIPAPAVKASKQSPGRSSSLAASFKSINIDGNSSNKSATSETPTLPLSLISPDMYDPGTVGRQFPWGLADPYNETHCDFVKLKENVFSEWRTELRTVSRHVYYEGWRTSRLNSRVHTPAKNTTPKGPLGHESRVITPLTPARSAEISNLSPAVEDRYLSSAAAVTGQARGQRLPTPVQQVRDDEITLTSPAVEHRYAIPAMPAAASMSGQAAIQRAITPMKQVRNDDEITPASPVLANGNKLSPQTTRAESAAGRASPAVKDRYLSHQASNVPSVAGSGSGSGSARGTPPVRRKLYTGIDIYH